MRAWEDEVDAAGTRACEDDADAADDTGWWTLRLEAGEFCQYVAEWGLSVGSRCDLNPR